MIPTYWILVLSYYSQGRLVIEFPAEYPTVAACTQAGREAQWPKRSNGIMAVTACKEVRR